MEVIRSQLVELSEAEGTDDEVEQNLARSKELLTEFEELDKERADAEDYEKRVALVRSRALDPRSTEAGGSEKYLGARGPEFQKKIDPFDTDPAQLSKADAISRAMVVVDTEKRVPISDDNKAHLDYLVHRSADEDESQFDGSYIARRTLYTENPLYRSAWKKYMRLGSMAAYNHDEQRAVAAF